MIVNLPTEQNLVVLEGWITDNKETQHVRLTRSNSFSGVINPSIEDASVSVQMRKKGSFSYSHTQNGTYLSNTPFTGQLHQEYRVTVTLSSGEIIKSQWSKMLPRTEIVLLSVDSFEENDRENSGQTKTIFFPKIIARDSSGVDNYYRWVFYKHDVMLTHPEPVTLQSDRFFDGNFIPNLFDRFEYNEREEIKVELHSINKDAYDFLNLLKSQINTLGLGSYARTTPATVNGNLTNLTNPEKTILGFFGTTSISVDSTIVIN